MNFGSYESYSNDDFGGGGYMDNAASQGTSPATNVKGGGRNREAETLLPVTIKQLLNRQTDSADALQVDGKEVAHVSLVGLLANVVEHSTNLNFQLDDGTGMIDGRLFLPADDNDVVQNEMAKLQDGIYVRVVGSIRTFQDKMNLSCFSVTPISDHNEITHHFLEAIYVHLYNTRGPLHSNKANNAFSAPDQQPFGSTAGAMGSNNYLQHSADTSMDYGMGESEFTPEQQRILEALGTSTSDRGVKIDQLIDQLRGQVSEDQIRSGLQYLTSEGHVYSTIDENHFKRTA